jgi:hypothetical protein
MKFKVDKMELADAVVIGGTVGNEAGLAKEVVERDYVVSRNLIS